MAARTGPHPAVPCSTGCGTMLKHDPRRKGTKCRACSDAAIRRPPQFCTACGATISKRARRTTTLCRSHAAKSEARIIKLRASLKIVHADPEYQARRGRAITAAKLAHIPLEYRHDYRELERTKGMTMAERIEAIQSQIAADTRHYLKTGQLPQTSRSK